MPILKASNGASHHQKWYGTYQKWVLVEEEKLKRLIQV